MSRAYVKGMINLRRYLGRSIPAEGNSKCKGPEVRVKCKRNVEAASGQKKANEKIGNEVRKVDGCQAM